MDITSGGRGGRGEMARFFVRSRRPREVCRVRTVRYREALEMRPSRVVLKSLLMLSAIPVCGQLSPDVRGGTNLFVDKMPREFRVLDWNIDRGQRLEAVVATIRKTAPDICVLQEVDRDARRSRDRDVARELASRIRSNWLYADAFQELGQGHGSAPAFQGQAFLTLFPVRSARVLRFRRQTGFWKPIPHVPHWGWLQRRLGGRIALVAEFGRERTEVVVYNLHLESRGPGAARYAQLRETLADARRYPPGLPVIIAGDLNTKYRPGRFESALKRDGFRNCFPGRVRTHRLIGDLDWIFVRGAAVCEQAEVIRATHASDHDPLLVRIVLR